MKLKNNTLKTLFFTVVVFASVQVFGQTVYPTVPTASPIDSPDDFNLGTVTYDGTSETFSAFVTPASAVAFYKTVAPGTSVNLGASLNDGNGNTFVSYIWYEMSYDGTVETENVISGETASSITIKSLSPGYHKFRVRGQVGTTVSCPSVEYQDAIIFVLPPLDVTPTIGGTNTNLTYCENNPPVTGDLILSASVTADYTGNGNAYAKPGETDATADFALTYQWYKIPATSGTGVAITGATSATLDLSTLSTPLSSDTYTFYVDVEYASAIKDKGTRIYVTYGGASSATSGAITVTPTPGTPTISITGISD